MSLVTLFFIVFGYGLASYFGGLVIHKKDRTMPLSLGMALSVVLIPCIALLGIGALTLMLEYPYHILTVCLAVGALLSVVFGRKLVGKISFSKITLPKFNRVKALPEPIKEPVKRSVYELFESR